MTEEPELPKVSYGLKADITTKEERAKYLHIKIQIVNEKIENSKRLFHEVFENPEVRAQLREDFDWLPEDIRFEQ